MAMNNATIGLGINLGTLRTQTAQAAGILRTGLSGSLNGVFGGLGAQLGGALAAGLSTAAVVSFSRRAIEASDRLGDSVINLRAALQSVGNANVDATIASVRELGDQVRLAFGFVDAETNQAFAQFINRGFSPEQARELTNLAAVFARRVNRPLEETSASIAGILNGNLGTMSTLGVQVQETGDKVADTQRALTALREVAANTGTALTDSPDRAAANWEALLATIGDGLMPTFDALNNAIADFNAGFRDQSGQKLFEDINAEMAKTLDFLEGFAAVAEYKGRQISNLFQIVAATAVPEGVSFEAQPRLPSPTEPVPFFQRRAAAMDLARFNRERGRAVEQRRNRIAELMQERDSLWMGEARGEDPPTMAALNRVRAAGAQRRAAAEAATQRELDAARSAPTFTGGATRRQTARSGGGEAQRVMTRFGAPGIKITFQSASTNAQAAEVSGAEYGSD